jgi:hypothetical protein
MIEKVNIESMLIQISGQMTINGETVKIGLMNENAGLGLKRKLRKIQKELIDELQQFRMDLDEVEKIEDVEEKTKEKNRLMSETFALKSEPVMMSEIEKIESDFNYNWELLELIAS